MPKAPEPGRNGGPPPLVVTPAYQLYNEPVSKATYLFDRLVGTGAKFAITGTRGVWKSWLMTHMAVSAATHLPLVGRFAVRTADPKAGSVLFFQFEEKRAQAKRKLQWTIAGMGMAHDPRAVQDMLVSYVVDQPMKLGAPGRLDQVKRIVDDHRPDLVLWDSLLRMHDGESRSDEYAERLIFMIDQLQEVWPSAHGFTAHWRKKSGDKDLDDPGERVRGTSALIDQVDAHLAIERDRTKDFATLIPHKNRDGEEHAPFNFRMVIRDQDGAAWPEYVGTAADADDGTAATAAVVGLLVDGAAWPLRDVVSRLGRDHTERQVRFAVDVLERRRAVLVEGAKGRPKSVRLRGDNQVTAPDVTCPTPFGIGD